VGGVWRDGGSSSTDYYSIATGGYVGTVVAATSSRFMFKGNGTYESEQQYFLNGASGKQRYNGQYSFNQCEATLTGQQSQDDNGQFDCKFEAVRGGFILHMTHKQFSGGQRYTLFRTPE